MSNSFFMDDGEEFDVDNLVEQHTDDELMDVDLRLATADHYRAIVKNKFFADESTPAAQLVDREMRAFVKNRLEVLLGLRQEREEPVAHVSEFSPEEVSALKALAAKVMGKPQLVSNTTVAPKQEIKTAGPVTVAPTVKPPKIPTSKPAKPKVTKVPTGVPKTKATIDNNGQKVLLVEGQVTEESGRRFEVVRNDAGDLYRKDLGPINPVQTKKLTAKQLQNGIDNSFSENHLGSLIAQRIISS